MPGLAGLGQDDYAGLVADHQPPIQQVPTRRRGQVTVVEGTSPEVGPFVRHEVDLFGSGQDSHRVDSDD